MESSIQSPTFISDYKKNVKDFCLEEPMDYFLFRPLAFMVLKLTQRLPLRPNHFSIFALCSALVAAFFLSQGTDISFAIGGIGILVFCVFDCCDGMMARMKNNGSKYGDLIDMFVDLLSSIAFFTGTYIGLIAQDQTYSSAYLVWIGGIALLIHTSIYQFHKDQYFNYFKNNPDARKKKIEQLKRDYENLKREKREFF